MQLMLIFGILFAIGAVLFALQNIAAVTVTLAAWSFQGSLALVLLVAIGLGVVIAGLLSSPTVIRGRWTVARLTRQVAELERKLAASEKQVVQLGAELEAIRPMNPEILAMEAARQKTYTGLRTLLSNNKKDKPPTT
jgi:putative membrane protein